MPLLPLGSGSVKRESLLGGTDPSGMTSEEVRQRLTLWPLGTGLDRPLQGQGGFSQCHGPLLYCFFFLNFIVQVVTPKWPGGPPVDRDPRPAQLCHRANCHVVQWARRQGPESDLTDG